MIQQEYFEMNGVSLVKSYSDSNKKIRQVETGIIYGEAVDIPDHYTYEETEEEIEHLNLEEDGLRKIQSEENEIAGN